MLASPNASMGIGYYGNFKTIGTLFWENAPGLRAAAEIDAGIRARHGLVVEKQLEVAVLLDRRRVFAGAVVHQLRAFCAPVRPHVGRRAASAQRPSTSARGGLSLRRRPVSPPVGQGPRLPSSGLS